MVIGIAAAGLVAPAWSSEQAPRQATAAVIEVTGLIDPVVADFITRAAVDAERRGREVLVIQLNSRGTTLAAGDVDVLLFRLRHAGIPVAVWVGPSGARAYGEAARLVSAADIAGMAPGTRVTRIAGRCGLLCPRSAVRSAATFGSREAQAAGAIDDVGPTLGDFIVDLDGREAGGRSLQTARVVGEGRQRRREPAVQVTFAKLGLVPRLLHTVSSPAVAYLLLVIAVLLVVFEFFTVGVGVAGAVGAACLVLSAYGLAVLPTRPACVALIVIGMLGMSIDVQAGAPRAWTGIGVAGFVGGSLGLYSGLSLRWPALSLAIAGVALFMVAAMPAMLRARFGTPTIGRESMIGEAGQAAAAIDPEGMVEVRGALWRARTNRATPIGEGDPVTVVGIDGLLLEVEPEGAGAASFHG